MSRQEQISTKIALIVNPNSCGGLTGKNWESLYDEIKNIFGARHLSCGKTYDQKDLGNSVLQENVETNPKFVERKPVIELQCFICGKKTGCNECEYLSKCEARIVSKYCLCKECSKQEDAFQSESIAQ